MKSNRILLAVLFAFSFFQLKATSDIEFKEVIHDFGLVIEGEPTFHLFTFSNEGTDSLKLTNVKASCGCTVPNWPKGNFGFNETGEIKITYDSKRIGPFYKTIRVTTEDLETVELVIKGVIVSKLKFVNDSILDSYDRKLPAITFEKESVNLGKLIEFESVSETITLTNNSSDTIQISSIKSGSRGVRLNKPVTILPNQSVEVMYSFTAKHAEQTSDIIVFYTSDLVNPFYELTINYQAEMKPEQSQLIDGGSTTIFGR